LNGSAIADKSQPRVTLSPQDLEQYATFLRGAKRRIDLARDSIVSPQGTHSIELAALQLRFVLEEIALSSLVTKRGAFSAVSTALAKTRPLKAHKLARNANLNYWPQPLKREQQAAGHYRLNEIPSAEWVTDREWPRLHGELSTRLLHARNPLCSPVDWEGERRWLLDPLQKLEVLLLHHKIGLADRDQLVIGLVLPNDPREVQVVPFAPLPEPEAAEVIAGRR
jgi:hypothetical protein